jgi:hypothetical protein
MIAQGNARVICLMENQALKWRPKASGCVQLQKMSHCALLWWTTPYRIKSESRLHEWYKWPRGVCLITRSPLSSRIFRIASFHDLHLQLSNREWDATWGLQHLESFFNADHPALVQANTILGAVKDFQSKPSKWIEDEKKVNPPSNPPLKKVPL